MRITICVLLTLVFLRSNGQFPYAKKINFPDQLPTQVIYDMLADTKGYIWLGTDKGLYRFNGRTFIELPFDSTSSKAVSYLQEDKDGVVWCMNFYNQLFYYRNDSLIKFSIEPRLAKELATITTVIVGSTKIWFHSFKSVYELDKKSHRLVSVIPARERYDATIATIEYQDRLFLFSNKGFLSSSRERGWTNSEQQYSDFRFIREPGGLLGIGIGHERKEPLEIINGNCRILPGIDLPDDVYILQGVTLSNNEHWLCTQSGAYRWIKETGETQCFLPNERVTDVARDYQGNYWFSTLDNGVFLCPSLYNTLLKIYNDPLSDNFTKIQFLPNGEVIAGNSQGLLAKLNLENRQSFSYNLNKLREIEFITYDTLTRQIFSNRGIVQQDKNEPVEVMDYSKGVARDKFNNLIVGVFNGAYVLTGQVGSKNRFPEITCPLYNKFSKDTSEYAGAYSMMLREKRVISLLSSDDKQRFWIGYEDGLFEYRYTGEIVELKDMAGRPVVAKSLQQQYDGKLVVGSSTRGVMIFDNNGIVKTYTSKNGLSSLLVRKVLKEDKYIWVLTDDGLDRIDAISGVITNYLEEYGLSNTIINDFAVDKGKIIFATPTGVLVRYNVPRYFNFDIRFPLLTARSNGVNITDNSFLPANSSDITFQFEALHYISTTALVYEYRLKGIDTIWRSVATFNNQLTFNRLSPGKYVFEIRAFAGPNYKSVIRTLSFTVPKPYWMRFWFIALIILITAALLWLLLDRWKLSLLKSQTLKEQLLKSQLVALRAQMNPHFLYNVLNTVQGLVYGNRKTEAGELLGNFSDLMRKTLQASDKQLLSLADEIENLRLYLELEKARFDGGFDYHIETLNFEDLSDMYIPSLLLQPFAENSVKHGLMHKAGDKKLLIRFEKTAAGLLVLIDDNGIGRAQSMEINKRSMNKPGSFATAALTERMQLFNRLYKEKIHCEVIDKTDTNGMPAGTLIELLIPDYRTNPQAL